MGFSSILVGKMHCGRRVNGLRSMKTQCVQVIFNGGTWDYNETHLKGELEHCQKPFARLDYFESLPVFSSQFSLDYSIRCY